MKISYIGYRFPPEFIRKAIWLYVRFTLSFRDVEDLLAELLTAIVPPLGTSDKARTLSNGL
jgi:transposase-like protein